LQQRLYFLIYFQVLYKGACTHSVYEGRKLATLYSDQDMVWIGADAAANRPLQHAVSCSFPPASSSITQSTIIQTSKSTTDPSCLYPPSRRPPRAKPTINVCSSFFACAYFAHLNSTNLINGKNNTTLSANHLTLELEPHNSALAFPSGTTSLRDTMIL
jgi:hypothetical protein